uniref:Olfactory receptor family 7 subfamily A member 40 n=1 Tax=Jaculus jaculus TaxID=51337 RepID=A0A8C5K597_JACJA
MEPENYTKVSHFLLLGVSEDLFGLFLSTYLVTVLGNLLTILASSRTPPMLVSMRTQSKVINYEGCIMQTYFFTLFGVLDNFLLTIMAHDRFEAICRPLHYPVVMNRRLCTLLVLASWVASALNSLLQSLMALRLSFCTDPEIPHFFCELNQVVLLACSDTFPKDMVMYFAAGLLFCGPLAGILCSYSKIVSSIRTISSAQGKYKAFSTCASHLSVVSLFYLHVPGAPLPHAAPAPASVAYSVLTPMLNPFIDSLRNKDPLGALSRLFRGKL